MKSPLGALLAMGAMLGAACPPMGRGFPSPAWRPRCRMPTHKHANPNKKRRRKARQKAQRRNR